jgi:hypothetical protein
VVLVVEQRLDVETERRGYGGDILAIDAFQNRRLACIVQTASTRRNYVR